MADKEEKQQKHAKPDESAPAEKKKPVVKAKAGVVKKKRWLTIIAPKLFNEQVIGETYLAEPDSFIGKSVEISMMVLTGEPQRQHIQLKFKVTSRNGEKFATEMVGYRISAASVRKMGRKGKERMEESFEVATSDRKRVRLKPMLTTRGMAQGGVLAKIRRIIKNKALILVSRLTFEQFLDSILSYNLQRELADAAKKIYPIANSDIRMAYLLPGESKMPIINIPEPKQEQKDSLKNEIKEESETAQNPKIAREIIQEAIENAESAQEAENNQEQTSENQA